MILRPAFARSVAEADTSQCATLGFQLAAAVDQPAVLDESSWRHVESCLRCQAELASYRKLRRSLAGLRTSNVAPPAHHLEDLLASFGQVASVHPLRRAIRRRAYLGGVAAAITAAGAGAVVLAARLTSRSVLAG